MVYAKVDDKGDTGDTLQSVSNGPIRDGSEFEGVRCFSEDGELEDLAHPR